MNRREFLKSLLAVVNVTTLPAIDVMAASEEAVDRAWDHLQAQPPSFYVNSYGTITSDLGGIGNFFRLSRAELYDIRPPGKLSELSQLARVHSRVQDVIEDVLYEAEVDDFDELNDDQQNEALSRVQTWLEEGPDENDAEYVNLTGANGQGDALHYFRDHFEYCDEFNIVIVEGDCPGSSYYAAELRIPVEEANEVAQALGLPIRFAWME